MFLSEWVTIKLHRNISLKALDCILIEYTVKKKENILNRNLYQNLKACFTKHP